MDSGSIKLFKIIEIHIMNIVVNTEQKKNPPNSSRQKRMMSYDVLCVFFHPVILTEECVHRQDRGLRWFVVNRRSRHFSILKAHNIGKHLFVSIYSCDPFKWCQAPLDQSAFLNLNLIGVLGWGQALMESFFLSAVSLSIAVRA